MRVSLPKLPQPDDLGEYALCLGLAALGGVIFYLLNLPLPWMLGAMAVTIVAATQEAPIKPADGLRPAVVSIIGVMLGSGFHSGTFSQIGVWSLSLGFLYLCIVVQVTLVSFYFRKVCGMDPVTALFSSMPGGLVEMMEIGKQYGGDEKTIILSHAARIVLVIALTALWFRVVLGLEVSGVMPSAEGQTGPLDLLLLLLCALIGAYAGTKLKIPAPTFLGPMLCSATIHIVGLTESSPPLPLVIGAQVILGSVVGGRFLGVSPRRVGKVFVLSLGATGMMLAIALLCAFTLTPLLGQSTEQILLAFAPGGLTEMSLISLSMGSDVAYIATHHLIRVVTLLAIAGTVLSRVALWLTKDVPDP